MMPLAEGIGQTEEYMAFNKSKLLESALKYLSQGKVSQAIAEYQLILRSDPQDQATLMTVGDLFARQGDMAHAIEYFERLAQVYLHNGFNSKAIAIYKKIGKLAPAELRPLERLADLYIQQGVLSEARPLFLQIAEAHLKANRAPKAVEVLRHLLEVEPENPRVQMRLAELYNVMGQKKEAAQTYFTYAQRLFERSDSEEAQKLLERALALDPAYAAAILLKAKILGMANKNGEAIAILEGHPDAGAGGELTNLLVDLELRAGQGEKAAGRARLQLARGNAHFALLYRVAEASIESGHAAEALALLRELREPMIDEGQQDKFLKSLSSAAELLPGQIEPLEMIADFCRHTSDPFHLTAALMQLVDINVEAGNQPRAIELLEELIERNKNDERLVARLNQLRRSAGAAPSEPQTATIATATLVTEEGAPAPPPAFARIVEEPLDEETERYVAQALTDVDLFSSYGLVHKASHLLENVLERAPRHTPTLERLFDMTLGAGDDRRTAEQAAQLEQIHRERGDDVNADRFGELRKRFQKALGLTPGQLQAASPVTAAAAPAAFQEPAAFEAVSEPSGAPEFEVPLAALDPEQLPEQDSNRPARADLRPATDGEEVDLSDEWEAIAQEVAQPPRSETQAGPATPGSGPVSGEAEAAEIGDLEVEELTPGPEIDPSLEVAIEVIEEPTEESSKTEGRADSSTTDDLISELAAQIDGLEPLTPEPARATAGMEAFASATPGPAPPVPSPVPEATPESLNELAGIFQEFRTELGELGEEQEDLETHYNLGIAYREMGLLDEAIGEFQKVAQAVQTGKPFPYAMNCSIMLAVTFLDKGEPKIASLWYQRALGVPGLDPETILALRYDLGISLEMAGESHAALDSFRQVYAMNIDYRDVANRIATLQHR
jgi:tetratricopeptide (TPR) repeat protein